MLKQYAQIMYFSFTFPRDRVICKLYRLIYISSAIFEWSDTARDARVSSNDHPSRDFSRCILVQSLNSPFFPPHIGAEPGRAKRESRITCMHMLRIPPFFPPKLGEKPCLEVRFRFGLWSDFLNINIQATIFAFWVVIKHLMHHHKSVEFHQCHFKRHSICFFSTISKITKEISIKICWQLKTPTQTWKCARCIMQMSYLYASDFPFKTFCKLAQNAENTKKCLGKE